MQFWKKTLSFLLTVVPALLVSGCAGGSGEHARLSLEASRIEARGSGIWLVADAYWKPSAAMLGALDHGIALTLELHWQEQSHGPLGWRSSTPTSVRHRELRYFPLSRRYQVRDVEQGVVHSYGVRAAALAALGHLELPLADGRVCSVPSTPSAASRRYRLEVDFDAADLPGALRLPALVLDEWQQAASDWTWPCADSA